MISINITGSIISDVRFDEVVLTYNGVTTVSVYKLKGVTQATVTETVDTNTPPNVIHLVRT
jgi:hypothetical protein